MKKYLIFVFVIPFILLFLFNTFLFHINYSIILKIILWDLLFLSFGHLLMPWIDLLWAKKSVIFLAPMRAFFIVIFSCLAWVIPYFNLLFFNSIFLWSLLAVFFLFYIIGIFVNKNTYKDKIQDYLIDDILFQFLFIFFLVIHSILPEFNWGEKTMDMSLLSFFVRRDYFPIMDPWSPDTIMKYYYLGYYTYAGFLKMIGIGSTVGYMVVAATLPALMGGVLKSLIGWITKNRILGIFGSLFIIFSSNFASVYVYFQDNVKNHFWESSRVFNRPYFAEFPIWSFIFKDLHPHVYSYPLTMLFIFLVVIMFDPYFSNSHANKQKIIFASSGMVLGSMIGINGWDFIIYSFFIIALFCISFRFNNFRKRVLNWIIFVFFIFIPFLPFLNLLRSGKNTSMGIVNTNYNGVFNYFLFLGNWWFALILLFSFLMKYQKSKRIEWSSRMALYLVGLSLVTILLIENFYFIDRTNTIFKVMNNVWIWFALGTLFLMRKIVRIKNIRTKFNFGLIIAFISFSLLGTGLLIKGFYKKNRRSTLDPLTTLRHIDIGVVSTIKWINNNVIGTPTILEAVGRKGFDNNTLRITKFTGLPVFIGWPYHNSMRGTSLKYSFNKIMTLEFIYNTPDVIRAFNLLQTEGVTYVFIGETEKRRYSSIGLKKFFNYPEFFKLVFEASGSYLFKLRE